MKKLLALTVLLCSIFCVFSCNTGNNTPARIPVADGGVSFSEFVKAAANNSAVKTAEITTTEVSSYGELTATLDITYSTDGSSVIEYSIDRYGSDDEAYIVTDEGVVECDKNGNYTADGNVNNVIAGNSFALNLDEYKLNDARIEGSVLYAKVFSADTEAVLGVKINATVTVAIVINSGKIISVSAEYILGGKEISVECEYGF